MRDLETQARRNHGLQQDTSTVKGSLYVCWVRFLTLKPSLMMAMSQQSVLTTYFAIATAEQIAQNELWPAGYSLIKLKEELWMPVVLRGLGPSFQHIRNGYAGAEKQDATTLERLLDSNDVMDSATGLQTAFAAQAPPTSALNASGRLCRPRPASLLCLTASGV
jgi:hypothetical protein